MNRRRFLATGAAAAAGAATARTAGAAQPAARQLYELRTYELRNDLAPARAHAFFAEQLVPALARAGAAPVGAFTPEMGMRTPSVVLVIPHATPAGLVAVPERLAADARFRPAMQAFERGSGGPPYVRYESALYRAFAGHPRLEAPTSAPTAAGGSPAPGRLFELRTYEAPNAAGLAAKVAMFNEEEIRIFRAVGMAPVFFGEAIAAPRMPQLTYMLAFDDMAARDRAWRAFGGHPDWERIRTRAGWTDPEAVSGITASFLRPTAYSGVR
jgi:hypothetical protein